MLDYVVVKKESYTFVKGMARGGGGGGPFTKGFEKSFPLYPFFFSKFTFWVNIAKMWLVGNLEYVHSSEDEPSTWGQLSSYCHKVICFNFGANYINVLN